jgi:hypothetical protein
MCFLCLSKELTFFLLLVGWDWVPRYLLKSLVLRPLWPIVQTPVIDEDDFWSNWLNENWQGKPKYSEKTCPSATLSTTNSHMTKNWHYLQYQKVYDG